MTDDYETKLEALQAEQLLVAARLDATTNPADFLKVMPDYYEAALRIYKFRTENET
jgi:hypothetical protein